MTADIEQNDLFFGYKQRESNAIAVGKADCMATGQFTRQWMQSQGWLKRVALQFVDHFGKTGLEIGMFPEKPAGLTEELLRGGNDIHVSHRRLNQAL